MSLRPSGTRQRVFTAAAALALSASCLLVGVGGCSKPPEPAAKTATEQPSSPTAAAVAVPPAAPIQACALLTTEEVAAVQGEPVVGTKPSSNQGQGLAMYDCFFTLPTFTNSISLSITQASATGNQRDPRQSWKETLAAADAKESHKTGPARMVEGIGDEAFWTGNERMGALYVLKGARDLRISVGGPGDSDAKIAKCRALAEAVMKHL